MVEVTAVRQPATYLAVDLGASSGRVIAGWLDSQGLLRYEEVLRFPNGPRTSAPNNTDGPLVWDFDRLLLSISAGVQAGIQAAIGAGRPVVSVGVDSWGVDFGLLDQDNNLIGEVVHYRDSRTEGVMERVTQEEVGRETIYGITGIQFLPFNTIYQLVAVRGQDPALLDGAHRFLMVADLVHLHLTGRAVTEYTNATTTQLVDATSRNWSTVLLSRLRIPTKLFGPWVQPGEVIGSLLPTFYPADNPDSEKVQVTAVATHDTGSAVVAVPHESDASFAYLSSGTWSLLGTELTEPCLTPEALRANFTNEGGACGTIRFLKNIMGLWLLQETRSALEKEGHIFSFAELVALASKANGEDAQSLIDPDDGRFFPPGDMPARIRDYCRESNQPEPQSDGALCRVILRSLALKYRMVLRQMESLTGQSVAVLHVVGGGAENKLLCQWTANACGITVEAGPSEATALGNLGMQMVGLGKLPSIQNLRALIRQSYPPAVFQPQDPDLWNAAASEFQRLVTPSLSSQQ